MRCASGIVKSVIDAPGEAVGGAELGDADDFVLARLLRGEHGHPVADLDVAGVGGVPVDDDLVGGLRRPAAFEDVELVEFRIGVPAEAERGRAVAADRLPVLAHDLGVGPGDVSLSGVDARCPAHDLGERGRDVRALPGAEVALQDLVTAHDRVGVLVDVREEVVERLLDRRGEHRRAGHERDADDHRERGEHEAQLVRGEALAGDFPHRAKRPAGASCRESTGRSARGSRRRCGRRRGR